jgi:hypothetical protein
VALKISPSHWLSHVSNTQAYFMSWLQATASMYLTQYTLGTHSRGHTNILAASLRVLSWSFSVSCFINGAFNITNTFGRSQSFTAYL